MSSTTQNDALPLSLVACAGPSRRHPSERIDPIRFLQAVTASLDLSAVLGTLSQCLHDTVTLSGWEYRGPDNSQTLRDGQCEHHRIEYDLTCNEHELGTLTLMRSQRFSAAEQTRIAGWLSLALPAIRNALYVAQITRQLERDPLTGLGNRRALTLQGEQWLADCVRHEHPFSMLVLDLDRFKAVNDTHGHPVGDRVLGCVAETLMAVTRTADLCVRLGGDEFCVLLPNTDLDAAHECAARIRQALTQRCIETDAGQRLHIRASIGAATHELGMTLEQLYQRADSALYAMKQASYAPVASWSRRDSDRYTPTVPPLPTVPRSLASDARAGG
ncbi:diguanylate cyclase (GGDEF) domain-containing protein [Allochromatium warmingii]|uniref:diguanylate cyclase n=1 Tax=Allochromatium warmingii TaxID=61595 RepID=A0A1H3CHX7_ALLWA|nr:GGDEF domain-containing protein [Allochromatium warmingii]SDX53686.1 diguanylate cyclase (GGDEF) domain-containing protein [Allochromatium warmingii]